MSISIFSFIIKSYFGDFEESQLVESYGPKKKGDFR